MKIVMTDCITVTKGDIDLSVFEKYGEVVKYDGTSYDETIERLADADAVLCNKTVIDAKIMAACPKLKYIGLFATGYNNIDTEYAHSHGVTVCNAGSYSTNAVVQHTFGLILELCSSFASYIDFTAKGGWKGSKTFSPFVYRQTEICGKTLGIVGYGSIGKAVAKVALAFGMKVIVSTRTPKNDPDVEFVGFDELLCRSDIITVHCPLTDKTKEIFNADTFAKCKDGVLFVNTSRGGVVNEKDLADALECGKVGGAGVDVLTTEPMSKGCPLFGAKNIIFTPHVAWAPFETRVRLLDIVENNLKCWLEGHPVNVV